MEGTKLGSSHDKENKSKEQLFLSAKVCLLSLKQTLEDLHKKDLFPYNPKPLLKRSVTMMIFSPLSSVIYCFASTFAFFIQLPFTQNEHIDNFFAACPDLRSSVRSTETIKLHPVTRYHFCG